MSDPTPTAEQIAKSRFQRLTVVRLSGVVLALIGASIMAGKVALPPILGLLLVLIGLFDTVVFPVLLIRRWKRTDK